MFKGLLFLSLHAACICKPDIKVDHLPTNSKPELDRSTGLLQSFHLTKIAWSNKKRPLFLRLLMSDRAGPRRRWLPMLAPPMDGRKCPIASQSSAEADSFLEAVTSRGLMFNFWSQQNSRLKIDWENEFRKFSTRCLKHWETCWHGVSVFIALGIQAIRWRLSRRRRSLVLRGS